jgi:hypothetical protein
MSLGCSDGADTSAAIAGSLSLGLGSTHVDLRLCKHDVTEPTTSSFECAALASKTVQPEGGLRQKNGGDKELIRLLAVSETLRVNSYGWTTLTFEALQPSQLYEETATLSGATFRHLKRRMIPSCLRGVGHLWVAACDVQAAQTKDALALRRSVWQHVFSTIV